MFWTLWMVPCHGCVPQSCLSHWSALYCQYYVFLEHSDSRRLGLKRNNIFNLENRFSTPQILKIVVLYGCHVLHAQPSFFFYSSFLMLEWFIHHTPVLHKVFYSVSIALSRAILAFKLYFLSRSFSLVSLPMFLIQSISVAHNRPWFLFLPNLSGEDFEKRWWWWYVGEGGGGAPFFLSFEDLQIFHRRSFICFFPSRQHSFLFLFFFLLYF